uniref:Uncharacterized protein n=1 Tax=Trichobilharzia regenti TaxID=157069 RepID=A0AA85JFV8_TRIRE
MQVAQISLYQLATSVCKYMIEKICSSENKITSKVCKYVMSFAPSKYKVLLQDWREPVPALTLAGELLEFVDKFVYLGSCVSAGGGVTDEISNCIMKARVAYINLSHLWRRRDVSLAVKDR